MNRRLIPLLGLALVTGTLHAAESGPWKSQDGEVSVTVSSLPPEADTVFPTNRLTSIRVLVDTAQSDCDTVSLEFDASMPGHGHGMNTRPRSTRTGPREFRVDGIKMHMPGQWLLSFRVGCDGTTRDIEVPLEL